MTARDPVCGMNVDAQKATSVVHGGTTYYFCSAACKAAFERNPRGYTER